MIDLKQIEDEIRILEQGETTYENIRKLSWLYTVQSHLAPRKEIEVALDNDTML